MQAVLGPESGSTDYFGNVTPCVNYNCFLRIEIFRMCIVPDHMDFQIRIEIKEQASFHHTQFLQVLHTQKNQAGTAVHLLLL